MTEEGWGKDRGKLEERDSRRLVIVDGGTGEDVLCGREWVCCSCYTSCFLCEVFECMHVERLLFR